MNIEKTLEMAPAKIAEIAEKAEKSRICWKLAEITLKQQEAKKTLTLKAMSQEINPKISMAELNVQVNADDEIYKHRELVIMHESEYKKDMIEFDKWMNGFIAARKLAELKIKELYSTNDKVSIKSSY